MTSDVIDTARDLVQAGAMTNIGEVLQVVQVEPLSVGGSVETSPADVELVETELVGTP